MTEVIAVAEPRLELSNRRPYVALRGGSQVSYYSYEVSAPSASNWNFNIIPPSPHAVLDRCLQIQTDVEMTFTRAAGAANHNILQPNFDAFAAFPISSITDNVAAKINGTNVNVALSEVMRAWQRYHMPDAYKNKYGSISPSMSDNYAVISDPAAGAGAAVSAAVNNPLADYDTGVKGTRGEYPFRVVAGMTNLQAVVRATLIENVYLSPFIADGEAAGGLTGLNSLTFNWNLNTGAALGRIWKHNRSSAAAWALDGGANSPNLAITFANTKMNAIWITPKFIEDIPRSISYPISTVEPYVQTQPVAVAADATFAAPVTTHSQVISLQSIPQKMYVYARPARGVYNTNTAVAMTTTDSFFPIRSLSINYGNQTGLFSSATTAQLYQMSAANGLEVSWPEFWGVTQNLIDDDDPVLFGLCGAPVCIEFGKDIGLKSGEAPGAATTSNLQVTASFINPYGAAMAMELVVLIVYEGTMTLSEGRCLIQTSPLTETDVLEAPLRHDISYSDLRRAYGGSFLSTIRDISRGVLSAISRFGPPAVSIATALGRMMGDSGGARAGRMIEYDGPSDTCGGALYDSGASFQQQSYGYGGAYGGERPGGPLDELDRPKKSKGGQLMSRTKMKKTLRKK